MREVSETSFGKSNRGVPITKHRLRYVNEMNTGVQKKEKKGTETHVYGRKTLKITPTSNIFRS